MITGLGGIFYKTKDIEVTKAWYKDKLGIALESWGTQFLIKDTLVEGQDSTQVLSPTKADTSYFAPSELPFMLNFRVQHFEHFIEELKGKGVEILGTQIGEYGKFAWIMAPDGVKIELWEQ